MLQAVHLWSCAAGKMFYFLGNFIMKDYDNETLVLHLRGVPRQKNKKILNFQNLPYKILQAMWIILIYNV